MTTTQQQIRRQPRRKPRPTVSDPAMFRPKEKTPLETDHPLDRINEALDEWDETKRSHGLVP